MSKVLNAYKSEISNKGFSKESQVEVISSHSWLNDHAQASHLSSVPTDLVLELSS